MKQERDREKERERERERESKKESATSTSSRSLLWRGDLRGTLGHQSDTQRGGGTPVLEAGVFNHPVV
jgi:hypothetical protein